LEKYMQQHGIRLDTVAELVQGSLAGDGAVLITGFSSLEAAGPGDLTFLVQMKDIDQLRNSKAGAALVPLAMAESPGLPVIRVKDPYLASAIIHNHLLAQPFHAAGVHARACIGLDCMLGEQVSIGPLVVIGNRVRIGERVTIEPGTVIGDDVNIGDDTLLKANVTVAAGCLIGRRVVIHSGTVVGRDGYGYTTDAAGKHFNTPQVGIVRIDDDVEIGANTCVDRGAFGDTWIKAGTKIDNQVQIAHNVVIGENSLIVAQVGLAGSTTLGRNVVMGGQSSVKGHVHLADRVMVAARGGVHNDQPVGAVVGGAPAFPIKQWAKASAVFARLPEMHSELRRLKKEVAALTAEIGNERREGEGND
jgi:UDP-3-O-[3-hydroxymyristoyl] glucosamine N-acyltransferase